MRRKVDGARVARLATVRPGGTPHVVPVVFALDADRIFTAVDPKPKRTARLQRLENIRANPAVEVVVDHYEDDWSRIWWVRLRGEARMVEEGPEVEHAHALLAAKYPQYRGADMLGEVIAIEIDRWTGWSFA